jgi:hypothetical protein
VASDADFWVVTATAAPVIALAVVVIVTDSLNARYFFTEAQEVTTPGTTLHLSARRSRKTTDWLYGACAVTLVLQAMAFFVSLRSLETSTDWAPPGLPIGLELSGLFLLLFIALLAGVVKALVRSVGRRLPAEAPAIPPGCTAPVAADEGTAGQFGDGADVPEPGQVAGEAEGPARPPG